MVVMLFIFMICFPCSSHAMFNILFYLHFIYKEFVIYSNVVVVVVVVCVNLY